MIDIRKFKKYTCKIPAKDRYIDKLIQRILNNNFMVGTDIANIDMLFYLHFKRLSRVCTAAEESVTDTVKYIKKDIYEYIKRKEPEHPLGKIIYHDVAHSDYNSYPANDVYDVFPITDKKLCSFCVFSYVCPKTPDDDAVCYVDIVDNSNMSNIREHLTAIAKQSVLSEIYNSIIELLELSGDYRYTALYTIHKLYQLTADFMLFMLGNFNMDDITSDTLKMAIDISNIYISIVDEYKDLEKKRVAHSTEEYKNLKA